MKLILSLLLLLGLISCSGAKKAEEVVTADAGIELADSEEFLEDDPIDESMTAGNTEGEKLQEELIDESGEVAQSEPVQLQDSPVEINIVKTGTYTVEKSETLMIISFKLFGDYSKWKELMKMNEETLKGSTRTYEGMKLNYLPPINEFVWAPSGNPYLIRNGDTLGTISNSSYGTIKYWKNIWKNNDVLIKDPNKIFTGFTLYTPVIKSEKIASAY